MNQRKFIQRCLGFIGCMLFVLLSGKVVKADLIWTPNDNFYHSNYDDCEVMARFFTSNGADGSVVVKESPKSNKTIASIDNGTDYFVSFTYTGQSEVVWGVIELEDKTGWVLMKDLALIYDNIAFMEEYAEKIKYYDGEFDDYVFTDVPVILWTYPESGIIDAEITEQNDMFRFSSTYTDTEGRQWGYISYYYGGEGWVCFDDPTNKNIVVIENQPQATIIPPNTDHDTDFTDTNNKEVILLLILVTALVVGTAILIRVFWKKK